MASVKNDSRFFAGGVFVVWSICGKNAADDGREGEGCLSFRQ